MFYNSKQHWLTYHMNGELHNKLVEILTSNQKLLQKFGFFNNSLYQ